MDIDLETAEALFKNGSRQESQVLNKIDAANSESLRDEKKNKKKKHHKSRSRSHSIKKKSKKHRSKSRSRSGKRKHKHSSKSPKKEKKRVHSKSKDTLEQKNLDLPLKQEIRVSSAERIELRKKELEQQIEKLNKEAEEAAREDLTVMVYQLPTKAEEKDIWRYLTKDCHCSKVRDIKLIRDQKTKNSKGVAYAEFYTKEDVDKALASDTKPFILNGVEVPMSEVRVQHSQAEKNRAALAAKQFTVEKTIKQYYFKIRHIKQQRADALKDQLQKLQDGPVKIFVGGLNGPLVEMTSQELKDIFQQYGDIDSVELPQNIQGKGLGFGYIVFKKKNDAQEAIKAMNGFKLQDQKITCTPVTVNLAFAPVQPFLQNGQNPQMMNDRIDLDQNENNIYLHTAQKRLELMRKLAGNSSLPGLESQMGQQPVSNIPLPIPGIANLPSLNIAQNQLVQNNFMAGNRPPTSLVPTSFIVLVNMFTEADYLNDPSFFADLKEDVTDECKKYGEVVEVVVVSKSPCGSVFVMFQDPVGAVACAKSMDGRCFNSRSISCYCISQETLQDEMQAYL